MVQNKDIDKEKLTNGETKEAHTTPKINGIISENDEYSEEEDEYLNYLLIVPSLDKNVSSRNMSLISDSLSNFYTTIENKKEYQKIKEELMGDLIVPIKEEITTETQETIDKIEEDQLPVLPEEGKSELSEPEITKSDESAALTPPLPPPPLPSDFSVESFEDIEVIDEENVKIKKFSLNFSKARIVPEAPLPQLYDQYLICRRCTIFFKTKKFRKMHNTLNHRRKAVVNNENAPAAAEKENKKVFKPRQRIRNGIKGEPLVCDLCSKSFKVKALIRSHMNCHTDEKPIQCNLCPYAGKRSYDLKKHHFIHHNPDRIKKKRTRRRKCDQCEEILENKIAYKLHMRLNHKEKVKRRPRIFKKCEKCDEPIYTKKAYKIHMKEKHVGFMYIKCDRCNRRFKTNFRLKKHKARYANANQDCKVQIRNTGEFVCEHCQAKFTLKSYLSLHMRKHRVYECQNCKMSFKSQFSLKYHEFSHLDIEPKCTHCEKAFQSEQKFANHLKRKTCMLNGLTNGHAGSKEENGTCA